MGKIFKNLKFKIIYLKTVYSKIVFAALMMSFVGNSSFATSDSIGKYKYIYLSNIQESGTSYEEFNDQENNGDNYLKGYCVASAPYYDGVSTSLYPAFFFMTQPFEAKSFGIDGSYNLPSAMTVNLNELSNANLKIEFTHDTATNYEQLPNGNSLYAPSFVVDVSRFPSSTVNERFQALIYAKLAILGIIANIENPYSVKEGYKAKIKVVRLPNQTDIVNSRFTKVHAQTNFPYSVGSPVVSGYKAELLSSFCN